MIFIVVLCAHKIMFMHVPLVPCLALAGNSNKLQLQAMRYMLHASYGMSMPRPECVVSCKIVNFIELQAFYCVCTIYRFDYLTKKAEVGNWG